MTATTGTVVVEREGLTARRAPRKDRVRAAILLAFGCSPSI